jgi:dolichyl-phosphate-mannose-protein mannosyltransferase
MEVAKMNLKIDFELHITKKDIITMVLLAVIFFSIAVANLGLTQTPTSTAQLTAGQSFYINLGSQTDVKSMVVLLKQGQFNFTISSGSPGNWTEVTATTWPPSSEDYYKWNEISVQKTTQFLKIDVGPAGYNTIIAEIAVIDQKSVQVPFQSITDVAGANPNLHNLIDEQNMVQYPSDYMSNTYFDEIYFVRTAEQYLHSQLPYEWTHPPLGKLIQAAGIVIFGFDPFGWRIMGVIFATLMIPLMYLAGKKFLGTWIGGFTAAFLLTFDFMHFTMARMGTADTYVVFFSLASQLFFFIYLKNVVDKGWKTSVLPLFLAFLFFALGFSSKWLVLYGFVGMMALLILVRIKDIRKLSGGIRDKAADFFNHPYPTVLAFIFMAVAVYFLTYIPDMLAGRSFIEVVNLQGQMFDYHYFLKATHPFASPWFSWPFMFDPISGSVHVPVWLQVAQMPTGTSTIAILGNPAVWWVGFGAIIALTVGFIFQLIWTFATYLRSFKHSPRISLKINLPGKFSAFAKYLWSLVKRITKQISIKITLPVAFLVVVFFFQWLPYVLITRVIFIYHFYVNVPFLCLGTAFFISKYWSNKWMKILAIAYFALTVVMFVLFYPVISGAPASPSTIASLKWFKSWVF